MKNFDNIGEQKANYENFGDTISVSPSQDRNITLDTGLTCRNIWW